ncbi:cellulose synthase complex periplasmic endoglucanase BcsZ [Solimonas marina]|uniref:cellulase n=1 Tax=Solimonas marina TaxID=2714601 RepID=A0A969WBY7_9GAMM|nr:cellulose synthase complex periplasmic endoglucanase BcsZ [Solimonas marina]NKF23729.1 cellulase [Solimonas marina]
MPRTIIRTAGAWLAALSALLTTAAWPAAPHAIDWPDWQSFDTAFIDPQGRVIDWTDHARTVSEGQAYALFFSLVANDRRRFAQLLSWTEQNLAKGDLQHNLPAWLWGERQDGSWGVLDPNSASDADLWLAYTLLEAGRLWNVPDYVKTADALLKLVEAQEIVQVPGGPMLLLPGPQGFVGQDGSVRFNPSYYVPMQLVGLQTHEPNGPWLRLLGDYAALLPQIAPLGRVPDWTSWHTDRIVVDPQTGGAGSYDAIRVYLWAGMMPPGDNNGQKLCGVLRGYRDMVKALQGQIPEHWTTGNSGISGNAPPGFYAALMPFLRRLGDPDSYNKARTHLQETQVDGLYGKPARYYDQVLALFGKGFVDGRFRFDAKGRLIPSWQ